ncbi:hypothetical protein [Micromonospora sp. NPDC092111]
MWSDWLAALLGAFVGLAGLFTVPSREATGPREVDAWPPSAVSGSVAG